MADKDVQDQIDRNLRKQFFTAVVTGMSGDQVLLRRTEGEVEPDVQSYPRLDSYNIAVFGTATIMSGSTSVVVPHGLDDTPTAANILWQFTEEPDNNSDTTWVSDIDGTNFTINVKNNPGASNLDFSWCVMNQPPQIDDEILCLQRTPTQVLVLGKVLR